jgi:hypothetical protein
MTSWICRSKRCNIRPSLPRKTSGVPPEREVLESFEQAIARAHEAET